MSDALTIKDFEQAMFSRLTETDPKIWPNQFELPAPKLIKPPDLRKGEPGWIRTSDLHWIVYNKERTPFVYDDVRVSLVPQKGYDLEVRRQSGGFDLHVMFESTESFEKWMNDPDSKRVYADFDRLNKNMGHFARVLIRTDYS